jgi:hypothetical protein
MLRATAPFVVMGGGGIMFFSEAPMEAPRREFRLIQLSDDWHWRLDIMRDDGLIGPFVSRDEAEKDARETLGIREAISGTRRSPVATKPATRPPRPAGHARRAAPAPSRCCDAAPMSAALVIFVALLFFAMLALFGLLWAALHFGVGHDDVSIR